MAGMPFFVIFKKSSQTTNMVKEKNKFLRGAVILTLTGIVAKVLGAFYRVPLVSMIGSKGIGIFQLIFPIYTFFLIFVSGGTSLGISKLVSVETQKGNAKNVKTILKASLVLMLFLSVLFGVIFAVISIPLAVFQGEKNLYICYLALVPALVFSSLISSLKGYYQGKQNMLPSGVSQIVEQVLKLVFSLLLSKFFMAKGVISAVFGVFLGISVSELGALLYLFVRLFFKRRNRNLEKVEIKINTISPNYTFKQSLKLIIKTCLPIMLNGAIIPLVYAIESSITIWLLSRATISNTIATSLFGLEDGIVGSLINLPTVISSSLAVAILPSITASWSSGDKVQCENKAKTCLKLTWLIALPCAVAFLLLSEDLVLFLYNNGLSKAVFDELKVVVDLVKISSINIVYISLLNVVTSILQGINKSYIPVRNLLIASIVKLVLTIVLVSSKAINIYGLIISDAVCFMLALILDLVELKKYLRISFDIKNFVLKPVCCVLVMTIAIFLTKYLLSDVITARVLTLITILVAGTIYLINIFLTKTLKKEDIVGFTKRKIKQ
mgnify:CR=1 FL=1